MPKFATTKLVEAILINKKTGIPMSKRIEVPYGAVIEDAREERGFLRFLYLGEMYDVRLPDINGYYHAIAERGSASTGEHSPEQPSAPAASQPKPAAEAAAGSLKFEPVKSNLSASRAKVPGGWLVAVANGVTFLPDSKHAWDGGSV